MVTFLFTDIEGSTALWERHPEAMQLALAQHDAILRSGIETREGHVFKTAGDAFYAAFGSSSRALEAALAVQRALLAQAWPAGVAIRVRMAISTGPAQRRDGDYFMSVARVGDTLVTQRLAGVSLPDTVYVGLFVCSHNASVTERAIFSKVRIKTLPK